MMYFQLCTNPNPPSFIEVDMPNSVMCLSLLQAVDVSKERIYLDASETSMTADGLPRVVPDGFPRYHFFLFKHSFEGDYQESVGK